MKDTYQEQHDELEKWATEYETNQIRTTKKDRLLRSSRKEMVRLQGLIDATWTLFCKRTEDPKLSFIERELGRRDIKSRRNGESFHAPILQVPEDQLDAAWELFGEDVFGDGRRFDDIEDDDPIFGEVL
jgi:hypothetical protein